MYVDKDNNFNNLPISIFFSLIYFYFKRKILLDYWENYNEIQKNDQLNGGHFNVHQTYTAGKSTVLQYYWSKYTHGEIVGVRAGADECSVETPGHPVRGGHGFRYAFQTGGLGWLRVLDRGAADHGSAAEDDGGVGVQFRKSFGGGLAVVLAGFGCIYVLQGQVARGAHHLTGEINEKFENLTARTLYAAPASAALQCYY